MKFHLKYTYHYSKNYGTEDEPETAIENEIYERSTGSINVFIGMLKEFVDPCGYELTDENILKEFKNATPDGIKTIRNYYSYRNAVYDQAVSWLGHQTEIGEIGYFNADIPEEFNWFSADGLKYKDEKQIEFSIRIEITE